MHQKGLVKVSVVNCFRYLTGSRCPDPGTPPHARQIPVGRMELSYEVDFELTYECLDAGYTYSGDNLKCVVDGSNVVWNVSRGSCEGRKRIPSRQWFTFGNPP